MTAEVGVLNRAGVALAADSAVTIGARGSKIYTSADKLFQLTNHAPVGIMVYGSADLLMVPWETIIKEYRKNLGEKTFPHLIDYYNNFIGYLSSNASFFPKENQSNFVEFIAYDFFGYLLGIFKEKIEKAIEKNKHIKESEIKSLLTSTVQEEIEITRKYGSLENIPKDFPKRILNKHKQILAKARKEIFEKLPLSQLTERRLSQLVAELISSKRLIHTKIHSGIVVSGFGDNELFPTLVEATIAGVVDDLPLFARTYEISIDYNINSCVVPFAQKEMVHTFMDGIDPEYGSFISSSTSNLFIGVVDVLIEEVRKKDKKIGDEIQNTISTNLSKLLDDLRSQWNDVRKSHYSSPVMQMVASLPKDELAAMAEALVNLTKFKRRVSTQQETVGGPIDVAVITKGDGFVWVKRKHYFEAELNPRRISMYCHKR